MKGPHEDLSNGGAGDWSPAGVQGQRPWRGVGQRPTKAAPRQKGAKLSKPSHALATAFSATVLVNFPSVSIATAFTVFPAASKASV